MCMALQQSKLNVHKFTEGQGSGTAITQCWTHMVLGSCSWISLYPPSTHMAEFQAGWGWECHLSFLSRSLRGKKKNKTKHKKLIQYPVILKYLFPIRNFWRGWLHGTTVMHWSREAWSHIMTAGRIPIRTAWNTPSRHVGAKQADGTGRGPEEGECRVTEPCAGCFFLSPTHGFPHTLSWRKCKNSGDLPSKK